MERNTLFAIILSTIFLIIWFHVYSPKVKTIPSQPKQDETPVSSTAQEQPEQISTKAPKIKQSISEKQVTIETDKYKAVLTSKGAGIKHWYLKEQNGKIVDLILVDEAPALATLPDYNYKINKQSQREVTFSLISPQNIKITKTYKLSDRYLHELEIKTEKLSGAGYGQPVDLLWDAGLGTDTKEESENFRLMRILGYPVNKPHKTQKLKPGEHPLSVYQWVGIDNRYFLASFILNPKNGFSKINVTKNGKKEPVSISLSTKQTTNIRQKHSLKFYLGPKGYSHLKNLKLNLEEAIDFGFFGFLGKIVLQSLEFFHKLTGNYGWAIVILTICLQIIVFPLSMKSFKASIAMKKMQPLIKSLQEKYKSDPKRLNMEMLNLYKTKKVNPLGGCLPMILQLPIFWALFITLRNAYELRGASWILWIKDLSLPDTLIRLFGVPINILPLIMGVGMFVQQKMMTASTDPTQNKLIYMLPIVFTFIFWNFPSGLVLYWLTNNILTLSEQYFVMKRQPEVA